MENEKVEIAEMTVSRQDHPENEVKLKIFEPELRDGFIVMPMQLIGNTDGPVVYFNLDQNRLRALVGELDNDEF